MNPHPECLQPTPGGRHPDLAARFFWQLWCPLSTGIPENASASSTFTFFKALLTVLSSPLDASKEIPLEGIAGHGKSARSVLSRGCWQRSRCRTNPAPTVLESLVTAVFEGSRLRCPWKRISSVPWTDGFEGKTQSFQDCSLQLQIKKVEKRDLKYYFESWSGFGRAASWRTGLWHHLSQLTHAPRFTWPENNYWDFAAPHMSTFLSLEATPTFFFLHVLWFAFYLLCVSLNSHSLAQICNAL